MPSTELIKSSDGTGNVPLITVQSVRSPGATTIVVDTVENLNATFMGSMGTPHTFIDPVTAEEITVISEATCVDFTGQVSGTNIEIVSIAPGFTDLGSQVGDIIIIKPTTEWANNIADTLSASHDNDGTLKADAVDNAAVLADGVVEKAKLATAVQSAIYDGWASAAETWTYASASTFTVSGDQTTKYTKGTRLKWTQTTVKYGVVIASSYSAPNTTVTIATNTDYTIENTAIALNYYSYAANPQGYPSYFAFTPTFNLLGGGSWGNGVRTGRFCINGRKVDFWAKFVLGTTTNFAGLTGITVNLPVAVSSSLPTPITIGSVFTTSYYQGFLVVDSGTATASVYVGTTSADYSSPTVITSSVPIAWANGNYAVVCGTYEAA